MRCISPLFVVNSNHFEILGKSFPSIFKKKIFGLHDYNHFVEVVGVPAYAFTRVNCGQCISCRVNKAREWAERCYLESTLYDSNYFITLTYDDFNLPLTDSGKATLCKRDLTLFWKRLRKWCSKTNRASPRYFACGEYGDLTFRPHYHVILFNIVFDDLLHYKTVKRGRDVYTYCNSPTLERLWGKGFAVVCKVVPETCSYTAQYSLKKVGMNYSFDYACNKLVDENSTALERFNALCSVGEIVAPFNVQSKGLGGAFCQNHIEEILVTDRIPGAKVHNIRYFDKLLEKVNPSRLAELKDLRAEHAESRQGFYSSIKEIKQNAIKKRVLEHNKKKRLN